MGTNVRWCIVANDKRHSKLLGALQRRLGIRGDGPDNLRARLDSDEAHGVALHLAVFMPDTGEFLYSKFGTDKSLKWQLEHMLELYEICDENKWELEVWR
jgi:hypothetical protein